MNGDETEPIQVISPPSPLCFEIFTLFPTMFAGPFDGSIIKRARDRGLVSIAIHDIRRWTLDRHRTVDDTPYGGGAGMVMSAPPVIAAVDDIIGANHDDTATVILSASGRRFDQRVAQSLSERRRIALICGHYEGIDERAATLLNADQLSVGDVVLTGGEIAAIMVVDAVTRLRPGVIDAASIDDESHRGTFIEYPHFTRPSVVQGMDVPPVLLGGNHAEIARWRRAAALVRTARWRPDLIERTWSPVQTRSGRHESVE